MSYNGSGTFNINSTGQPVVAGTVISSSAFNALTTDLATGLTTAITKDGQTTTTARITFAQGVTSSLVTDSSSISTGSIITGGGVGIAKALYVGTTANVAGAVTLGGIATFSAQPIFSSLTASSAVATDASKGLVSVTNTGTGNNVLATSPTITTPTISSLSSAAATALTLQSAGTTAITVSTSQNVGIGTASPTQKLQVAGNVFVSAGQYVMWDNAGAWSWQSDASTYLRAYYAGNEALRIDSSGNVGINTTSPNAKLYVRVATNANLRVTDSSGTLNLSAENDAGSAQVAMKFNGSQMMLTSAGELLVNGTAAPVNGLKMAITNGSVKWSFGPDGSGNYCVFNASGTGVYVTNGGTSWTGTSDERLKTDLIPITNGLQKVNSLRSVTGRFKTDEEGTSRSFLIAQDVKAVFPEAVNTLNDEIGTLGLAYTDVIPLLVASIKELKAINDTQAETINALTARIVALESK